MIDPVIASVKALHPRAQVLLGLVMVAAIGGIDYLTGYEIGFSLFYVLPIALLTWLRGQGWGLLASSASAATWFWADRAAGQEFSSDWVQVWNTLIRLCLFVIISLLLSSLRRSLARERDLARIDSLTGALNSRAFYEAVGTEIGRLERLGAPFTLVYLDLDNFKPVNDQFGHSVGDDLLRCVVAFARKHLRRADSVARLGGDEFALLLPQTGQEVARGVLEKLRAGLLAEMQQRDWPVTFSVGAVSCGTAVEVDALIARADQLMYQVKRAGKNAIRHASC